MSELLVSIITPSLNQAAFIGDCVRSVSFQTYDRVEHIIVDGGSTDGTVEILHKLREQAGFEFISEKDDGQVQAIRKGFSMAHGDVVAWLNSDDVYLDRRAVEKVVSCLSMHPSANFITGGGCFISEEGCYVSRIEAPKNELWKLKYCDVILQPATFFRKTVLDEFHFDPSLSYAFDWEFFARSMKPETTVVIPDLVAGYRMYGRNKTAAGGHKRLAELAEVTRRNLGSHCWQYMSLRAFTKVDEGIESLPQAGRLASRRALYIFLSLLGTVTRNRIQT